MPYVTRAQYNVAKDAGIVTPPGPAGFLNGLVKFQMEFSLNSQEIMNVLYFMYAGTPGIGAIEDQIGVLILGWSDHLSTHLSNEMVLHRITATDLSSSGGVVIPNDITPPIPGGNTSSDPAPFVALNVRKVCGVGGRATRGFMRLAGVVGAQFTAGQLTSTAQTQLQNSLDDFYTAVVGDPWTLVVASFYNGGSARPVPVTNTVLGFSLNVNVTTQNSRKIGRGT